MLKTTRYFHTSWKCAQGSDPFKPIPRMNMRMRESPGMPTPFSENSPDKHSSNRPYRIGFDNKLRLYKSRTHTAMAFGPSFCPVLITP